MEVDLGDVPKFGMNPDSIFSRFSSAIINAPLDFVLDLLPSDAITSFLFC